MDKKFLFFDTETTGNEEKDFLCQVAYKLGETTESGIFKPPIPISIESMAVHHITQKVADAAPAFQYSPMHDKLREYAHDDKIIFVAHNAQFDLRMFKKEGIIPERYICTLRLARALDPDEKIPSYRLQYLRYFLGIEIEATAHDALGDVLVLEKLFERLKNKMLETGDTEEVVLEKMLEISARPSLIRRFNFGKYKGTLVTEVAQKDMPYLEWLYKEKAKTPEAEEDWLYTLKQVAIPIE